MHVILLGYRGSGKTSVGRILAQKTWKDFVDVDAEICSRFDGKTIAEIWEEDGEPAFRAIEVQVTKDLVAGEPSVIALGGGTVMQPEAKQAVKQAEAVRVYLSCRPHVLAERIAKDVGSTATRPALTSSGGDLEEIENILVQRDPVYREVADVVFDVTYVDPRQAAEYLVEKHL
jgi:shikimate kinase